jgi:hypothetical protein
MGVPVLLAWALCALDLARGPVVRAHLGWALAGTAALQVLARVRARRLADVLRGLDPAVIVDGPGAGRTLGVRVEGGRERARFTATLGGGVRVVHGYPRTVSSQVGRAVATWVVQRLLAHVELAAVPRPESDASPEAHLAYGWATYLAEHSLDRTRVGSKAWLLAQLRDAGWDRRLSVHTSHFDVFLSRCVDGVFPSPAVGIGTGDGGLDVAVDLDGERQRVHLPGGRPTPELEALLERVAMEPLLRQGRPITGGA